MAKSMYRQINTVIKKINQHRFRPSLVWQLMVKPRYGKGFSETAKRYIMEELIYLLYGKEKMVYSPYAEKGVSVEEDSITLLSEVLGYPFVKNKEKFRNTYLEGTPDILHDDVVIDVKSSWDLFTFSSVKEIPQQYYWQLQSYMWLTKRKKAILAYVLVNTPQFIVNGEVTRTAFRKGISHADPERDKIQMEIENNMTFDNIPKEERVKLFFLDWDPDAEKMLIEKITLARVEMKQMYTAMVHRRREDILYAKELLGIK